MDNCSQVRSLYNDRMSLIFFGTNVDLTQVWRWLFDVPGMKIFEGYSVPDQPNRWFDNWDEISTYLAGGWSLSAWPATAGGRPRSEKIAFEASMQKELGGSGRTVLHSPASIDIVRNNGQNGCLASASLSFWNEKGVRQRSMFPEEFIDEVDWTIFRSITGKIQRQIRNASPATLRSAPIMPGAFGRLASGEIKLWNWGQECVASSPFIAIKK